MPEEGRSKRFGYEAEIEGNLEEGLKAIKTVAVECAEALEGIKEGADAVGKTLESAAEAAGKAVKGKQALAKSAVEASAALYATREALFGLLGPMGDLQWTLARYGPILSVVNVSVETYARQMFQSSRNVAGMIDVVRTLIPVGIANAKVLTEMGEQAYRFGAMTGEGAQSAASGLRDIMVGLRATREEVESLTVSAFKMSEAAGTSVRGLGQFVSQVGFLGEVAGFTKQDILMLGTVAQAAGLSGAEAGAMFSNIFHKMRFDMALLAQVAGPYAQEMATAMLTDPMQAMEIFLQALEEAPPYMEYFYEKVFGFEQYSKFIQLGRTLGQMKGYMEGAASSAEGFRSWLEATGQWTELLRIELTQLRQSVTNLVMSIARYAAPVVAGIARGIREITEMLARIPEPIKAALGYALAVAGVITTLGTLKIALAALYPLIKAAAFAGASLFTPLVALSPLAVVALGAIGYKLFDIVASGEKLGDISTRIGEMFTGIGDKLSGVWAVVKPLLEITYNIVMGTLIGLGAEFYRIIDELMIRIGPGLAKMGVDVSNLGGNLASFLELLKGQLTLEKMATSVQEVASWITSSIMFVSAFIALRVRLIKDVILELVEALKKAKEQADRTGESFTKLATIEVGKWFITSTGGEGSGAPNLGWSERAEASVSGHLLSFLSDFATKPMWRQLEDNFDMIQLGLQGVGASAKQAKDDAKGSSFLGLEEGVAGALPAISRLTDQFDLLGEALDRVKDLRAGPTIATTRPEASRYYSHRGGVEEGFAAPAIVVSPAPVVNVAAAEPTVAVETIGSSQEEAPTVQVPITVVLDGRTIAEALVEHQALELMRRHQPSPAPVRGVGV